MQITWYGHSAFRLDFARHAILIDPFFTGNPAFVSDKASAIKGVNHIVLTHGHGDHVGDTLDIAKSNGATVTTNYDLGMWLVSRGLEKLNPMNTGGTTDLGGFTVSLVRAIRQARWPTAYPSISAIPAHHQSAGRTHDLSYGRHRHFLRHGSNCRNPSAAHRHGPDWRSLYDERGHRCDGDQAFFQARCGDPLPLRIIPDHRCDRREVRRGDAGTGDQSDRAGKRQSHFGVSG